MPYVEDFHYWEDVANRCAVVRPECPLEELLTFLG